MLSPNTFNSYPCEKRKGQSSWPFFISTPLILSAKLLLSYAPVEFQLTVLLHSNNLSSSKHFGGSSMNLNEDFFKNHIPFQVGNIVEVKKERVVTYGMIEEVNGRFADGILGKTFHIYYRINNEVIAQELVTRKVSDR